MTPRPGIYFGVDFAEYLSWEALSKTGLVHFAVSPKQYQKYLRDRDAFKPTDPMIVGTAVDILVFDGLQCFYETHFKLPAGVQRRAGTTDFDIQRSKNPDKVPLAAEMWNRVFAIADAVQSEPESVELLERSEHQVSCVWREPITGVLLKIRLDMWDPPWCGDLKVTNDVHRSAWRRTVRRFRHDWQAALYSQVVSALTCEEHTDWDWLTVRDQPEHSVQIYDLDVYDLKESWVEILEQLETFRICKDHDHWPSSSGVKETISLRRKP